MTILFCESPTPSLRIKIRSGGLPPQFLLKFSTAFVIKTSKFEAISSPASCSVTCENPLFKYLLHVDHIANYDFEPLLWKTSYPTTINGLSQSGISEIPHGHPPILAVICMNILFTIERKFLPRLIVFDNTT